jgi:6-phosphofructokinase 1
MYGIYDSFLGCCDLEHNLVELTTKTTERWLDQGGSMLGIIRSTKEDDINKTAKEIAQNLHNNGIQILYVIGGDGSMQMAHAIAGAITARGESRSVIGIPKTMDNDVLWVSQSFGFDTAVEQATKMINTLRSEAESTRRICIIELFGADSGFVAANASLASGHVDAVLIPEVFKQLLENKACSDRIEEYLDGIIDHIAKRVRGRKHNPHAVVIVAEGIDTMLRSTLGQSHTEESWFVNYFKHRIQQRVLRSIGKKVSVFINQPRHYIRAIPADSHDQIFCERLGALAVDTALAGYTDCMVSQWLTEFVLVPLELVTLGKKSIHINGIFWKQVVNSTGQPLCDVPVSLSLVIEKPILDRAQQDYPMTESSVDAELVDSDTLRIRFTLPALLNIEDFIRIINDRLNAVEILFSVFAILESECTEAIKSFLVRLRELDILTKVHASSLHQFLATANKEPLRVIAIHYGSPVSIDLLGIGKALEVIRDIIKDIAWRGKDEKESAELKRKRKEVEIDKMRIENKKQQLEMVAQKIEIIQKLTLTGDDKELILALLMSQIAMLSGLTISL